MEDINWIEMIGRRVLTRVTETHRRRDADEIVVYLREIEVQTCTDSGEQVQFSKPYTTGELEWSDASRTCLRVSLLDGGVQTYEFIADVTRDKSEY